MHVQVRVLDSVGSRIGLPAFNAASLHSFNHAVNQSITSVTKTGLDGMASGAGVPGASDVGLAIIITTIKI